MTRSAIAGAAVLAALLVAAQASSSAAQTTGAPTNQGRNVPPPSPSGDTPRTAEGVRTHDGFLFRLMLGGGYVGCQYTTDRIYERTAHLGGGELVLQFGGSVSPSATLAFELTGGYPDFFAAGPALGLYTESNFFVDASFGYAFLEGVRGTLTVGKEWWVSDQWGMGLAFRSTVGTFLYADLFWKTYLYLSATYS